MEATNINKGVLYKFTHRLRGVWHEFVNRRLGLPFYGVPWGSFGLAFTHSPSYMDHIASLLYLPGCPEECPSIYMRRIQECYGNDFRKRLVEAFPNPNICGNVHPQRRSLLLVARLLQVSPRQAHCNACCCGNQPVHFLFEWNLAELCCCACKAHRLSYVMCESCEDMAYLCGVCWDRSFLSTSELEDSGSQTETDC